MNNTETPRLYLDYASATPLRLEAEAAYKLTSGIQGNPGSIHEEGRIAAKSLLRSREALAHELGAKAREIVFTSGLTEANNLAILGYANHLERSKKAGLMGTHWIVSSIEHQSVLACFAEIERRGGTVTHIDPDARGLVLAQEVQMQLREDTVCVSIGWANSETGMVQPLRDISQAIHASERIFGTQILFHVDAGQAPLYFAPSVHTLGVDLFSLGSGKLYGPRGIGALYIGKRAELGPIIVGGGQERGMRGGTESPALAAGFAAALVTAGEEREKERERLHILKEDVWHCLEQTIPGVVMNGAVHHSLPHMLNFSIPHIQSEYLILALDQQGIACSTKSACSEGRVNESHVIVAMVKNDAEMWRSRNSIRVSFGIHTKEGDMMQFANTLSRILKELPVSSV